MILERVSFSLRKDLDFFLMSDKSVEIFIELFSIEERVSYRTESDHYAFLVVIFALWLFLDGLSGFIDEGKDLSKISRLQN